MANLTHLTIKQALDGLKKKEFTATQLVEEHIKASEAARHLNCYITETFDAARAEAKESDKRYASGNALPLDGIPIAMKDLYCTEGVQTTAASLILKGFKPPYESTVTANMWRAGAVMLGKTNLDEFAMGSSNLTSYYGAVVTPWRRVRIPAVPSASLRLSAASRVSSRRMAAAPASALSPSHLRLIRRGPSARTSRIARCC